MRVEEWLGQDNKLGIDIWNNKYKYKEETFDEWLDRVSNKNEKLKQLILDKKFLFGGRTLINYNTYKEGASTSNCYSSGYAPDDLEGILELNKNIGLTYKAQGGQGISLSKIRPIGSKLSSGYTTDGIVPFMEIFNTTTAGVSQGGSRKGALMLSIDAWHKESETFIKIKSTSGKIEKANLSLEIDDEFMECVAKNRLTNKDIIINRIFKYTNGEIEYEVKPVRIFEALCLTSIDWAEPGAIFVNRFRNYNLMEFVTYYEIITGNPCGEQPLPKNGACNLGSLNLSEFVISPYTDLSYFDIESFKKAVDIAIEGLDEVIDYGYKYHALQEQRDMAYNYRNIGLGIMGLGSMLFKLGITYGSNESIILIDDIMSTMFRSAVFSSNRLAKEKGKFPKYSNKVFDSTIIKNHFTDDEIGKLRIDGIRNCSLLSVAPSGSIGTMLNITTGCEPAFRISYKRKTESLHKNKEVYYEVYVQEAQEYLALNKVDKLPSYFISSESINYKNRIDMQSAIQNHVDTAISSTVNLNNNATIEDVQELYIYAWEKGLKGITIYRDGCKRGGILTTNDSAEDTSNNAQLKRGDWKPLADDTIYIKKTLKIGCSNGLKLFIGYSPSEKSIQDLYIKRAYSGGCLHNLEGLVVGLSAVYRLGGSTHNIEKAFRGLGGCNSFLQARMNGKVLSKGSSCATAILNVLKEFEEGMELKPIAVQVEESISKSNTKFTQEELEYIKLNGETEFAKKYNKCPICGENELQHSGGCIQCVCGYSKCD